MTRCPLPAGSAPPPRSIASWLTSRGLGRTQDETTASIPQDIYVIGTQENSLGDREWVEFLRASLKTLMAIDYRVVTAGAASTRLAVPGEAPGAEQAEDIPQQSRGTGYQQPSPQGSYPQSQGPFPTQMQPREPLTPHRL